MEIWDAYDEKRRKLGFDVERGTELPEGARHLVVHMVYYNSRGEILVQRRADEKDLAPGIWAFTGGSAIKGETSEAACVRETREEMGFDPDMDSAEVIISYITPDAFVDVYLIKCELAESQLILQKSEVAQAKWLDYEGFSVLMRDKERFWQYRYIGMLIKCLEEKGIYGKRS